MRLPDFSCAAHLYYKISSFLFLKTHWGQHLEAIAVDTKSFKKKKTRAGTEAGVS